MSKLWDDGDTVIGNRLRQAREETHLTRDQAAEMVGIDRVSVWRYETGKRERIPIGILARLADLYGKSVDWFLEDLGSPGVEPHSEAEDLDLLRNEASLTLKGVQNKLSGEAIRSIADYIRFVHDREDRGERFERGGDR